MAITRRQPDGGLVVDVLRGRDLFYHYDAFGTLRTVPFEYKPPDVRVIIPYHDDLGMINRSNAMAANAMRANGIRVYIHSGMSHLKGAVHDGWACLGSTNFDSLSFAVNKELNIATSHTPAVEEFMERVFEPDFTKSVEIMQPFPGQWSDFLNELLADRL